MNVFQRRSQHQHRQILQTRMERHRNQILANSHDTSPQEDAEQNPQLHSGVTSPLPSLIPKKPEKTKGKDGLDLTSRLKAKALHYLNFFLLLFVFAGWHHHHLATAFPPTSIPILMYATSSVSHAAVEEQQIKKEKGKKNSQ